MNSSKGVAHIHIVKARATKRNDANAHFTKTVDDSGVDSVIDKHTNAIATVSKINGVLVELGFIVFKANTRVLSNRFKGLPIVRLGIKKSKFHSFLGFSLFIGCVQLYYTKKHMAFAI